LNCSLQVSLLFFYIIVVAIAENLYLFIINIFLVQHILIFLDAKVMEATDGSNNSIIIWNDYVRKVTNTSEDYKEKKLRNTISVEKSGDCTYFLNIPVYDKAEFTRMPCSTAAKYACIKPRGKPQKEF